MAEVPEEDKAAELPVHDLNLQPGRSFVDQFKDFLPGIRMSDTIKISQDSESIDLKDPYIGYLLKDTKRIDGEIASLEAYIRDFGSILMPTHRKVLDDFVVFLRRVQSTNLQ